MYIIGLMSGTSLDGIDAALVKVEEGGELFTTELISFITLPIPASIKEELMKAFTIENSNSAMLCSLNFKLGRLFGEAALKVCEKVHFPIENVDAIGSHGQTIYHIPVAGDGLERSTLQLGEPAVIAYLTNTLVVSNFRSMDMAAGGEGAPLVPYAEYLLYKNGKTRALQNIGGIGNVTVLPSSGNLNEVVAFDTGPGNMVIDELTKRLTGKPFDDNGELAAKGQVHHSLIQEWMRHPFFELSPPKSTGRELFGAQFVNELMRKHGELPTEDLLATATYFTVESIAFHYEKFLFPTASIDEIIIGGGGSYNKTMLHMLKKRLPKSKVLIQEDLGLSSEAKEAIAFALLAHETICHRPSNVPSATGATEQVILGSITFPPFGNSKLDQFV
jgi:anhydro-N-acetylmuramic acid kinase